MNTDLKCPFAQPLVSQDMQCCNGAVVARRAGPDVSCHAPNANDHCKAVYQRLLDCMLREWEMDEVDLNQIPHSALIKVQYGGLAGLASETGDDLPIKDIARLIENVFALYGSAENIPLERVHSAILDYRVKRRRNKT